MCTPSLVFLLLFVISSFNNGFCKADCVGVCDLPPLTCNFITYPIHTTGLDLIEADYNATQLIEAAALAKIALPECYKSAQLFSCSYYYPSCDADGNKIKPCRDTCTTTRESCALALGLLKPDQQRLLNCDSDYFEQSNTNCSRLTDLTPVCNASTKVGKCYDYSPEAAVKTGHLCSPFVSKQIYLETTNSTTEQIQIDFSLDLVIGVTGKIYPLVPLQCYKSLVSLMCRSFFPTCSDATSLTTNTTLPVRSLPCRNMCEQTNDLCGAFFKLVNITTFNCSGVLLGSINWEEGPSYTTKSSSGDDVTATCQSEIFANDALVPYVQPSVEKCPYPLAKNPTPDGNERLCWIPCPDPTYSSLEWDRLHIAGQICASIQFVTMIFLITTYLLDGKKRQFPANLHICVFVSAALLSIPFFLNGLHPKQNVWCNDAVTYASIKTNKTCGAQGFIFLFSVLSIMMWWLGISVNIFITVALGKRKLLKAYKPIYYIAGILVPLILTMSIAISGRIGYVPPASWCFVTTGFDLTPGKSGAAVGYDFTLFYIPLGIVITIAMLLMSAVAIKVVHVRRVSFQAAGMTAVSLDIQMRLIVFVLVLLILLALFFEWRFALVASNTPHIQEYDLQWAVCKIKTEFGISNPGICPESKPPLRINYAHTMFETILASSLGSIMFLVFGTDKLIYKRLMVIVALIRHRKWRDLNILVRENNNKSRGTLSFSNYEQQHQQQQKSRNSVMLGKSMEARFSVEVIEYNSAISTADGN